jgi:hypothetical protein
MATATFNTGIFIPLGENVNMYDLNLVITKDGFGEVKNFQYTLTNETTGVSLLNNRMSVESSAPREISITVSNPEKGTEAFAVTKPYIPYTAVFNTNIETPESGNEANSYDLDVVITTYGFGNVEITYQLLSNTPGVSLTDNILSVSDSAYGEISVLVTGRGQRTDSQAIAITKVAGFYATRLELINDESIATTFQNAIDSTKKDWSTLVGADRKGDKQN